MLKFLNYLSLVLVTIFTIEKYANLRDRTEIVGVVKPGDLMESEELRGAPMTTPPCAPEVPGHTGTTSSDSDSSNGKRVSFSSHSMNQG